MVVVRLTNDLKSEIISAVRNYHQPALDKATQATNGAWGARVYSLVITQRYGKVLEPVHKDFLSWNNRLVVVGVEAKDKSVLDVSITLDIGAGKPFPDGGGHRDASAASALHPYAELANYNRYWRLKRVPSDAAWEQLLDEIETYYQNIQSVKRETDAAVATVNKLLDQHATLSPALKAWPTLWNFVPEWAKDRHKLIKEVQVKPEIDLGNLDKMTSEIMAKRIVGDDQ